MKISYNYDDILHELYNDLVAFQKTSDDYIYVIRKWDHPTYKAIIDYSFDRFDEPHEKLKISLVIEEMEEMNKII